MLLLILYFKNKFQNLVSYIELKDIQLKNQMFHIIFTQRQYKDSIKALFLRKKSIIFFQAKFPPDSLNKIQNRIIKIIELVMGNKGSESKGRNKEEASAIVKQYGQGFENYRNNPNYFIQLFVQLPYFAKQLGLKFPKAKASFEAYYQMLLYLRGQQQKFQLNEYAASTSLSYNALDRFLLLANDISLENYNNKEVSWDQMDKLFIQYFKIFSENPETNTILKIISFMSLKEEKIKIKDFTEQFASYFRSSLKYLKDFYFKKFKKMQKNGRLLLKFTSKIVKNDAIVLALKIPRLVQPQIVELYNIQKHGTSFHSLQKQILGYTGPWLLLVQHIEKNKQGAKQQYVFGSYQNGPIKDVSVYQGDLTGFLFTIHPSIHFWNPDMAENGNKFFYLNHISNPKFNKRRGLGFGGNDQKQNFKLWIDEDIDRSYVYGGKDITYGYGNLASPGTEIINIKRIEIWGLGHKYNLEDQKNYWLERQEQILKRRKVDKKQLLGQNAGLFFEKTFAHRQQMIGQIQKPQSKDSQSGK